MRSLSALRSLPACKLRLALGPACAFAQAVSERDALVEDETLAAPAAFALGDMFEIIQDAALEVKDLAETLCEQIARRLFAADAAGAEHRDFSIPRRIEMAGDEILELAEVGSGRINRALKGADRDFKRITCIDQHRVGRSDQLVPVLGLHIG